MTVHGKEVTPSLRLTQRWFRRRYPHAFFKEIILTYTQEIHDFVICSQMIFLVIIVELLPTYSILQSERLTPSGHEVTADSLKLFVFYKKNKQSGCK